MQYSNKSKGSRKVGPRSDGLLLEYGVVLVFLTARTPTRADPAYSPIKRTHHSSQQNRIMRYKAEKYCLFSSVIFVSNSLNSDYINSLSKNAYFNFKKLPNYNINKTSWKLWFTTVSYFKYISRMRIIWELVRDSFYSSPLGDSFKKFACFIMQLINVIQCYLFS